MTFGLINIGELDRKNFDRLERIQENYGRREIGARNVFKFFKDFYCKEKQRNGQYIEGEVGQSMEFLFFEDE